MLPRVFASLLGLFAVARLLAADPATTFLSADDARFHYAGRFDHANPAQPVVIWSGSRVSVDFDGARLVLQFGTGVGQCVFNVTVDGVTEIADMHAAEGFRYAWPQPLGAGRHHLEVFKRSEASKGHIAFAGLELAAEAQVWAAPNPPFRLKMEFFGDSITAGACNEDGASDQWTDFRTHNFAKSWAHFTATDLAADDRAMAYSGMGVITGWETVRAGEIWDKVYPIPESIRADLETWQPDVAFVNLGENDDSFTAAKQKPFPADFTAGYLSLVRAIRGAYPRSQIVLLRGGMGGGARSAPYRGAWERAVQDLEAEDPKITHFVFEHVAIQHPRVADDRAMADELVAWLKLQPFMTSYLKL